MRLNAMVGLCLVGALSGAATAGSGVGGPSRLYVNGALPATGNGRSWATALNNLETALAAARVPGSPIVEIWVAQGVYKPTRRLVPEYATSVSFELPGGVHLYGGFEGNETAITPGFKRLLTPSILSGDLAGDDGPDFANTIENASHVCTYTGGAGGVELVSLDGFEIRGGNADDSFSKGGGGRITGGALNLDWCRFLANSADIVGGALSVENTNFRAFGCQFLGNRSGAGFNVEAFGGALSLVRSGLALGSAPDATLTNCAFSGNTAVGLGSAASLANEGCTLTVTNCTFFANHAASLCGGLVNLAGPARVQNSIFWMNSDDSGMNQSAQIADFTEGLVVSRSCVQNGFNLPAGNITADPRLRFPYGNDGQAGTPDDDLALAVDSPCIDAGDNAADTDISLPGIQPLPALDGFGQPRIDDGDHAGAAVVDMGVYEIKYFEPVFWLGDGGFGELTAPGNWYGGALPRLFDPVVFDLPFESNVFTNSPFSCGLLAAKQNVVNLNLLDTVNLTYPSAGQTDPSLLVDDGGDLNLFSLGRGANTVISGAFGAVGLDGPGSLSIGPGVTLSLNHLEIGLGGPGEVSVDAGELEVNGLVVVGANGVGDLVLQNGAELDVHASLFALGGAPGSAGTLSLLDTSHASIVSDSLEIGQGGSGLIEAYGTSSLDTDTAHGAVLGSNAGGAGRVSLFESSHWTETGSMGVTLGNAGGFGTIEVFDGATLTVPGGLTLAPGSSLKGNGLVVGDVFNSGLVAPSTPSESAHPDIPVFQSLHIDGNYTQSRAVGAAQNLSGALRIAVAAPGREGYVPLDVGDFDANLGGGLFIELAAGYLPMANPAANISAVTAGSISHPFDVAFFPGFPDTRYMRLAYRDVSNTDGTISTQALVTVEVLQNGVQFGNPISFPAPGQPNWAALGDVDDDNDLDLIITIPDLDPMMPGSVVILFNAGVDGGGMWLGFSGSQQYPCGRRPTAVVAAKLDPNNSIDLAVTNAGDDTVSVYYNDGTGSFTRVDYPSGGTKPDALTTGDIDGDTNLDLIVLNNGTHTVNFLINDGTDLFFPNGGLPFHSDTEGTSVGSGGMDEDKDTDVAVSQIGIGIDGLPTGAGIVSIYHNNGLLDGFPRDDYPVGDGATSVVIADFNQDGMNDIATADRGSDTISILLNTGTGGVLGAATQLEVGDAPPSLVAADMDNDGDPDLAVVAGTYSDGSEPVVRVLRNNLAGGQVAFAPAATLFQGTQPTFVLTGDVDNDGDPDVISLNNGQVVVTGAGNPIVVQLTSLFLAGDTNGDGRVDMYDLNLVLCQWAMTGPDLGGDVNHDGVVDFVDLNIVLSFFGSGIPLQPR